MIREKKLAFIANDDDLFTKHEPKLNLKDNQSDRNTLGVMKIKRGDAKARTKNR